MLQPLQHKVEDGGGDEQRLLGFTYSKKIVSWFSSTAAIKPTARSLYVLPTATHSTSIATYFGESEVVELVVVGAHTAAFREGVHAAAALERDI